MQKDTLTGDLLQGTVEINTDLSVDLTSDLEPKEKVFVKKTVNSHKYKRAFSESELLDVIDRIDFQENDCYHFITGGDIDSFSYIKAMSRFQDFKELTFSTWCMALIDVEDMENMIKMGKIKVLNGNAGEIFQGSYPDVYSRIIPVIKKTGGYFKIFRNHSKVYIVRGSKFDFVIESSANINTNPRAENTVLTVSKELADFYEEYFKNIVSFNRED